MKTANPREYKSSKNKTGVFLMTNILLDSVTLHIVKLQPVKLCILFTTCGTIKANSLVVESLVSVKNTFPSRLEIAVIAVVSFAFVFRLFVQTKVIFLGVRSVAQVAKISRVCVEGFPVLYQTARCLKGFLMQFTKSNLCFTFTFEVGINITLSFTFSYVWILTLIRR